MMAFFKELGHLTEKIEREIRELNSIPIPVTSPPSGKRTSLLREMSIELCQIKDGMKQVSQQLRSSSDFVEQIRLASALMKKQEAVLHEAEEHLSRYGFSPKPLHQSPVISDSIPSPPDVPHQQVSHKASPEQASADILSAPQPTEKKSVQKPLNLDRTPTLEDFGLSHARLKQIKTSLYDKENVEQPSSDLPITAAVNKNMKSKSLEDTIQSDSKVSNTPNTSSHVKTEVHSDLDKTPNLQDYGLSSDRLQRLMLQQEADEENTRVQHMTWISDKVDTSASQRDSSPLRYPLLSIQNNDESSPTHPTLTTAQVMVSDTRPSVSPTFPSFSYDQTQDTPEPPELTSRFARSNLGLLYQSTKDST